MTAVFTNKRLQLFIIVIVTFLAYSNIFSNDFVIDDASFIKEWPTIQSLEHIPKLLAGGLPPSHGGVYRPIRSVLYAVYYQLFGTNPFGWHLHSVIVHLAAVVLVYLISNVILRSVATKDLDSSPTSRRAQNDSGVIPFAAALLFGLHPIHTETITYIASSMDAIGIVFFFASFYFYLRGIRESRRSRDTVLSLFFALLAFFTNEMTLTLPLLILFHHVILRPRQTRHEESRSFVLFDKLRVLRMTRESIPYLALVGLYGFVRVFLVHATTRGPYLADSFYLTMLTMTKVVVKYMSLLILSINQANNHAISKGIEAFVYRDYRTEAIAAQTTFDPQILFSLTVIIGLIVIAIFSFTRRPLVTFSIGWFFISLLPVSEIIPQGSMLNERMLYIPSFGYVLFLSYVILSVSEGSHGILRSPSTSSGFLRMTFWVILLLLTLLYGYQTYQRNKDWKDEITLWSKDVQVYPTENAYAYYQLGNALVRAGRVDEAIPMYERSNAINTKFVLGLGSIAIVYSNAGMTDKAEGMYKKAISQNPSFWEGRFNLGNLYVQQEKLDLALEQYRAVLEIHPNFVPARENSQRIQNQGGKQPNEVF